MRVLAITSLFPNAARPNAAPFNRQQLVALGRQCELHVLAPILTLPGSRWLSKRLSIVDSSQVPHQDTFDGLSVRHPRVMYAPGLQGALGVPLFAASLAHHVLPYRGKVDVVFGAWAHPDGCAAHLISRALGVPCVVKVQGSDIDLFSHLTPHKYWLRGVLPKLDGVVAVSRALARDVEGLGVAKSRISLVYNGVDPSLFHVRDRAVAREALGLSQDSRWILFVGNLLADKGINELCDAFSNLREKHPSVHLAVIGKGPLATRCEQLGERVRFLGQRPLQEIPLWMAAADVVTLPSYHEGTPNVVLEALTCGRRVVATTVGGIPDLITDPLVGELIPPKDALALEAALLRAVDVCYEGTEVAKLGGRGDWNQSASHLLDVLSKTLVQSKSSR